MLNISTGIWAVSAFPNLGFNCFADRKTAENEAENNHCHRYGVIGVQSGLHMKLENTLGLGIGKHYVIVNHGA
jgi:hypothetical protein